MCVDCRVLQEVQKCIRGSAVVAYGSLREQSNAMTQSNLTTPDKHHGGARLVTEEKLMVPLSLSSLLFIYSEIVYLYIECYKRVKDFLLKSMDSSNCEKVL